MRNYLILKEKAKQFDDDPEIQGLLADIRSTGPGDRTVGRYSREKAENIKSMPLDRVQIANKPLPYERLDQLTIDILLGVR
jgi:xylose isomerase